MNETVDLDFRFRNFIECSRLGTWEWNVQTGETVFNDICAEMIGYTLDALTPNSIQAWTSLMHSDDLNKSDALLKRHFSGELAYYDCEYRVRHKNGHWVWIRDQGKVVSWTADEKPLMMYGTHIDITPQKSVEEKLLRNQTILSEAQAIGHVGSWEFDLVDNTLIWSDEVYNIFGIEKDACTITYDTFMQHVHPDDRDAVDKAYQDSIRKNRDTYSIEHRILNSLKPGVRYVFEKCKHIRDQEGHIVRSFGIVHDITDSKTAEQTLKESEQRLRSIIDAAPFGAHLYEVDTKGRLVFIGYNKSADSILGVTHRQFIGKTITDAFPPLAETEIPASYLNVAETGESFQTEQVSYDHGAIQGAFEVRAIRTAPHHMAAFFRDITESKKAEALLLKEQKFTKLLIETSPVGIISLDRHGTINFANTQAIRTLGLTGTDIMGRSFNAPEWRITGLNGEPFPEEKMPFTIVKLTGEPVFDVQHAIEWPDGRRVFLSINAAPLLDAEGVLMGMVATVHDITTQKQAEEVIQSSEAKRKLAEIIEAERRRLFELFELLPPQICLITKDHRVVFANRSYREMYGDVYSQKCHKANYKSDEPCMFCKSFDVFETGEPVHWEMTTLDGSVFEVHDFLFTDRDGSQMVLEMNIDISSRRKTELELQKYREHLEVLVNDRTNRLEAANAQLKNEIDNRMLSESQVIEEKERLSVTLRSIGDGVITTDVAGNIVLMNTVAENFTGWKLEDVRGKPLSSCFRIVDEFTRTPRESPVEKVLSTGKIIELENHTLLISRDGTERLVTDSGAPIQDINGTIIGVVLVFRDTTDKQRFLDITQNTQKLESLGILAGGIAHDFNNLLGGIFGYIDLARDEPDYRNYSEYLAKAMSTIDRARALTLQLLTFAKGGDPIRKIGPMIQFIQESVQFALSGKNILCTFDIQPDLSPCNYDKNQIGQVIDNLVINAYQAMPSGGTIDIIARDVSLEKDTHPTLPAGNYIRISVRDHGTGIPQSIIRRIFDPFFTTKPKGHGLGLATSYSIVNRHGGCLDVASVVGEGTTMHVYLPAADRMAQVNMETVESAHTGSGIFIVMDDEESIRDTLGNMLRSFGYDTICFGTVKDTVESFKTLRQSDGKIAAMIFDLTIPGSSGGIEAVEEIRKTDASIPVFVASGYAVDPVMRNPEAYGFTASINKPFRKVELAELLNMYLRKR